MNIAPASDSLRADHRKIEGRLDPLLEALLHLTAAGVNDVRRHFQWRLMQNEDGGGGQTGS